jgi:hypothetical protein
MAERLRLDQPETETVMRHSPRVMIAEVQREIRKRREVYPRLVNKGRMRHGEMEELIAIMESVESTLTELQQQQGETP